MRNLGYGQKYRPCYNCLHSLHCKAPRKFAAEFGSARGPHLHSMPASPLTDIYSSPSSAWAVSLFLADITKFRTTLSQDIANRVSRHIVFASSVTKTHAMNCFQLAEEWPQRDGRFINLYQHLHVSRESYALQSITI